MSLFVQDHSSSLGSASRTSVWGLKERLTKGFPQVMFTRSSDLWKWRKKATSQLPLSPPLLKAASPSSACRSSSVCSNLSPRTQMIVLDQVHKLSSLGRLFIIMYHVYKPLPAMVGHHKLRPDPQHPQLWSQHKAGPFSSARHTAPPSWC